MTTSEAQATRLKPGDLIILPDQGDEIFKISKVSTSAPGKHGHAKVRLMFKNLLTGSGGEVTWSGHQHVEKPVIEKDRAQVLSVKPSVSHNDPNVPDEPAIAQLMDLGTFETFDLTVPEEIPEASLVSGIEVEVRKYESKKWLERIIPAG